MPKPRNDGSEQARPAGNSVANAANAQRLRTALPHFEPKARSVRKISAHCSERSPFHRKHKWHRRYVAAEHTGMWRRCLRWTWQRLCVINKALCVNH